MVTASTCPRQNVTITSSTFHMFSVSLTVVKMGISHRKQRSGAFYLGIKR